MDTPAVNPTSASCAADQVSVLPNPAAQAHRRGLLVALFAPLSPLLIYGGVRVLIDPRAVTELKPYEPSVMWPYFVAVPMILIGGAVSLRYGLRFAWKVRGWYWFKRDRCSHCGYSTTGLRSERCPECGSDPFF